MIYLTGKHAMNLTYNLKTTGDWHTSALKWENLDLRESNQSIFKDYGLEYSRKIPNHAETFTVANHIRAALDLLESGHFSYLQGLNNDFICNPIYDLELFEKVARFKGFPCWN